ncbi:MAG TPA: carboxypeptidase-like regulatory domain-containing protein [Tepidisphaeraceae bacterium]|jgi:hypothetical protein|nr:carboxypeptidase-like regulatory domain-containing protein [Tepidisphaeraceae bacterium]
MKRHAFWIAPLVAFALVGMLSVAKAEDAKKATLNVKVTDADGAAVEGATVKVFPPMKHAAKPEKAEKQAADAGTGEKKKPEPVAQGTTDKDGVAKIEVDAGDYTVRANLKGKGNGMANASAKAGESTDVAIKLKPSQKKGAAPAAQ